MVAMLVSIGLAIGVTGPASAGNFTEYTADKFQKMQADGDKPILVFVNANWCPICAKERPIVAKLIGATVGSKHFEGDPDLTAMECLFIDFDAHPNDWRTFHVTEQSTLIVFRGNTEVGRAVGMTDPADIKALLMKAMAKG
jgi:thiol-disulfide isomerase/thioredoxin